MKQVLQMDSTHRSLRLKEIIKDKCGNITREDLDTIMSNINVNRIYLLKSTSSAVKFLNIATAESIHTLEKKTLSYIVPILGEFTPGLYMNIDNDKHLIPGRMEINSTCAAVKMSIASFGDRVATTYILAIYIPH